MAKITKNNIISNAALIAKAEYGRELNELDAHRLHEALSRSVMAYITENWEKSSKAHEQNRRACYLSAEFLVGRAIYNNLM